MAVINRIDIKTDVLEGAIEGGIEAAGDLTAPMAEIANEWLFNTKERFRKKVSPAGVPWVESPDPKRGDLFESGDLFNQLDKSSGPDFAEIGVQATGGPAKYARIHQEGGEIRQFRESLDSLVFGFNRIFNIPARPYIGFADEDRSMAIEILSEHVQSGFNDGAARAGGGAA